MQEHGIHQPFERHDDTTAPMSRRVFGAVTQLVERWPRGHGKILRKRFNFWISASGDGL